MSIDLHIHSTISDGTMNPAELAHYAHKKGLSAIAITDHDTIDGVEQALVVGRSIGLEVIPGIELSVQYGAINVHLLGYLFDCGHHQLHSALEQLQAGRVERNNQILIKLNQLGCTLPLHELAQSAGPGQTGRPHIARLMIEKGYVSSMEEAFTKYLGQEGLAYTSRFIYQVEEAITLLQQAGGIAVLAHPLQLDRSVESLDGAVRQLADMGLDGIEVYYPNHSRSFRRRLMALAEKYGLLMTGGSDYHGTIRPGTSLAGGKNVSVPANLLDDMKQRVKEKRPNITLKGQS